MRTTTTTELALLAAARNNHYTRIEVQNQNGTWKDLTALGGVNWVDAWEIDGENVDRQVATAKLELRRDVTSGGKSLSPLWTASPLNVNDLGGYAPLLDIGRAVRITTAVTAPGVAPVTADWKEMFLGRIDAIEWQSSPVVVSCSDLFAWIVDRFIEYVAPVGSNSGQSIEGVIQTLLHTWPPQPGEPTLYTPASPGWVIPAAFNMAKKSLAEQLKDLVDQIAWELRYRYDASSISRLTLFQPPRSKTVSDATISASMYRSVTKLDLALQDIRNAVVINGTLGDGSPGYAFSGDTGSQAAYGRRYMELPAGSGLTTQVELQALADAACSDLKAAKAEQEVELYYFWPAQLYDLFTFPANRDHYDTDQQLAVIGVKHAGKNGEIITTLTCRGAVAGAYSSWLIRGSTGANRPAPGATELYDLREVQTSSSVTFSFTRSTTVDSVWWAYAVVTAPQQTADWTSVAGSVAPLGHGVNSVTVPLPKDGQVVLLQLEPRRADLSVGTVRRIALPAVAQPPIIELDDSETTTVGTQFWKITERGIPVSTVLVQTQVGTNPISGFVAPTRGPGAASTVRPSVNGGILQAGEYEHDIGLDPTRFSWIMPQLTLANGAAPIILGPFGFDRDKRANIISVVPSGTKLTITGDSDTKSIRVFDTLGTWEYWVDGLYTSVDVAATGTNGVAGLGASATSTFTVEMYNAPKADSSSGNKGDTQTLSISGASVGTSAAVWSTMTVTAPTVGSFNIAIALKASAAPAGWTAKVFVADPSTATAADVSSSLSPAVSTPPTTLTTYTYTAANARVTPGPHTRSVNVTVTAYLYDNVGTLKDSKTVTVGYSITSAV